MVWLSVSHTVNHFSLNHTQGSTHVRYEWTRRHKADTWHVRNSYFFDWLKHVFNHLQVIDWWYCITYYVVHHTVILNCRSTRSPFHWKYIYVSFYHVKQFEFEDGNFRCGILTNLPQFCRRNDQPNIQYRNRTYTSFWLRQNDYFRC